LYGDRSGSPRRDDPQYGVPWNAGIPQHSGDVRVAGAPVAGRPGHGTAAAPPVTHVEYVPADQVPAGASEEYGNEATVRLGDTAYIPEGEVTRDDLTPVPEFGSVGRGGSRGASRRRIKVLGVAVAVAVVGGGAVGGWALAAGSGPGQAANRDPVRAQGPAPLTDAQRKAIEDQRLHELKKRASRAAREDDSKPMLFVKGTPPETKKPGPPGLGDPTPVGEAQRIARAMLPDFGWKPSEHFGCLVNLWDKESHWNTHASSPTGAYGIPQAKPGSKMASAGPDWQNSARTQIKWGLGYIKDRYSTPCAAWQHSESTGWY
jgi:hypothetical protein